MLWTETWTRHAHPQLIKASSYYLILTPAKNPCTWPVVLHSFGYHRHRFGYQIFFLTPLLVLMLVLFKPVVWQLNNETGCIYMWFPSGYQSALHTNLPCLETFPGVVLWDFYMYFRRFLHASRVKRLRFLWQLPSDSPEIWCLSVTQFCRHATC